MGIVLIGGIVLLVGILGKKTTADAVDVHAPAQAAAECAGGHIDLKGHGTVVDTGFDGTTLRVTLEKKEGQSETMLIDICTGKILGTLTIDTDAAVVEE